MSKLSIVVPIYNVEEYLGKCLESLKNQTVCDNYEVICVNDGSTDNSRNIILEYVNSDKRFKIFDKENGGLSDARNFGIRHVNSKYISFIDSDDFVSSDYVEKGLLNMEQNDLDIFVFSYNQYYLINNSFEKIDLKVRDGVYNLKEKKSLLAYTPNAAWNKIYKTELFKNDDVRYPFGYRHQDLGTTPKLLLKSKRIGYLDVALYNYLVDRPNNITTQIDNKLYHIIDMSKEVMDYYIKENVFDNYKEEFEYLVKRNCIQSLRKAMTLKDRKFVFQFINDVFATYDLYFKNNKHLYNVSEEKGDNIYLSKNKCKAYYCFRKMKRG